MQNKQNVNRDMLEKLSTEQLDDLLQAELHKEEIADDYAMLIWDVIQERESDYPVEISDDVKEAWKRFSAPHDGEARDQEKAIRKRKWIASIAATAAILCLIVFAVPPATGTANVFELIGQWTENLLEFADPDKPQEEYVFETDHPGLQQIYDEVVKLGVTQPVVPMWVPDGFELVELKVTNTPTKVKAYSMLRCESDEIILIIEVYGTDTPRQFEVDSADSVELEIGEITHYIESNDGAWVAVWNSNNLECSLTVDGRDDLIYTVLDSIYTTEDE